MSPRLTPTLIKQIEAWRPSVGYNVGICEIVSLARRRGTKRPRGCPFTTDMLGRFIRRENRRMATTFFAFRVEAP